MGSSLSVASVNRTREAVLLALRARFHRNDQQGSAATETPLSALALAAVQRRFDKDALGWVASSSLEAVLRALGLAGRWPRLEVDAFAHCFAISEDASTDDDGQPCVATSTRLDYRRFLDVVFFPITVSTESPSSLRITHQSLVAVGGCVVHEGSFHGQPVTAKEIALSGVDAAGERDVVRSVRDRVNALSLVSHANLIRYRATLQAKQSLFVVEETHAGCTLRTILASFGAMKEATIRRYAVQVLDALAFLHGRDVVHGNLTLDTIHINSSGVLKLSRFGIGAGLVTGQEEQADWLQRFPPPEKPRQRAGSIGTMAADVWGVGVLVLQMAHGVGAAADAAVEQQDATKWGKSAKPTTPLTDTRTPPIPAAMSANLRGVVRACLARTARQRPSVRDVLALEFFQIDAAQATREILRDVCSDLDASMRQLTTPKRGASFKTDTTGSTRPSTSSSSGTARPKYR